MSTAYQEFGLRIKCMGPARSYRALNNMNLKIIIIRGVYFWNNTMDETLFGKKFNRIRIWLVWLSPIRTCNTFRIGPHVFAVSSPDLPIGRGLVDSLPSYRYLRNTTLACNFQHYFGFGIALFRKWNQLYEQSKRTKLKKNVRVRIIYL